jgi:hypothetical protein
MERIKATSIFGTTSPPVSKKLKRMIGEEEAERRIKAVLANVGVIVMAWAQECYSDPENKHFLQDKHFHLDDYPQAAQANLMRLLAMRFLEHREEAKN